MYRKLVKPLQDYAIGVMNPDLLIDSESQEPIAELFEGSTYTNKENLPEDYIRGLESAYKGQMRERYLLGGWGAFEGLVYPQYEPLVHLLDPEQIIDYFARQIRQGLLAEVIEAYDHGIAVPACYGLGFSDCFGNAFLMDGFYEAELSPEKIATRIKDIRKTVASEIGFDANFRPVLADPAIFRRGPGTGQTVGVTVAGLLREYQVSCRRANNNIVSGIAKVQSYLEIDARHPHPITGEFGSPRFFVSKKLDWWDNEIVDYYWKKDGSGEIQDIPNDRKDHAMDMTKYFFTDRPRIALFDLRVFKPKPSYMRWGEVNDNTANTRKHRYG